MFQLHLCRIQINSYHRSWWRRYDGIGYIGLFLREHTDNTSNGAGDSMGDQRAGLLGRVVLTLMVCPGLRGHGRQTKELLYTCDGGVRFVSCPSCSITGFKQLVGLLSFVGQFRLRKKYYRRTWWGRGAASSHGYHKQVEQVNINY